MKHFDYRDQANEDDLPMKTLVIAVAAGLLLWIGAIALIGACFYS